MQKYSYVVKDGSGKTLEAVLTPKAANASSLHCKTKGLLSWKCAKGRVSTLFGKTAGRKKTGGKVPGHVLAFFAEQLSTLIAGGVPLVRAIALLSEYSSDPKLGVVLNQVAKDIAGGNSLHSALARHPKTFDNIWLSLVQAGEVGGQLSETLGQIAAYIKMQEGMKSKIITAITYPAILMVASVGVLIYFVLGIVPTFAQIFKDFNIELPMITVMVLAVSGFFCQSRYFADCGTDCAVFGVSFLYQNAGRAQALAFVLLSIPLFGNFLRNIYYSRMLTTLATLLRSGVTILNAIAVLEESFNTNVIIQNALRVAKSDVAAGRSISDSFRAAGVFPGLMTEMMLMGEESGKLPSIIATLSKFYSDNVDQFIARFSAVIDPILVVGVGVLIGIIVASSSCRFSNCPKSAAVDEGGKVYENGF